uniref:Uncharacterized protein n=1 Tax=Lotus japonicus TaxID=34305 RepID=I3T5Y7_LOTJA|nr:unknown [Lotus japonicus]
MVLLGIQRPEGAIPLPIEQAYTIPIEYINHMAIVS